MNRTDRLHALHEALRERGDAGATAASLARMFEVSVRTIKRDITALQEAGAPIWAQHGPGGGYRIDPSATLPPVALSAAQAVAVAVSLATLPDGSPFGVDARAAGAKLRQTLGPIARSRAEVLSERIWVLPSNSDTAPAAVLRAIERSITETTALSIVYRRSDGALTERVVEPVILAWGSRRWYLVAHCRVRADIRWFRVDRIEAAHCTTDSYRPRAVTDVGEPPDGAAPLPT